MVFLLRFTTVTWFPYSLSQSGRLLAPTGLWIVPQCWTIGVELTFYLIAPLTCRSVRGTAALFLFGLATRLCLGAFVMPGLDPWFYRFAPAEMMLFASGGLAYFAGRAIRKRVPPESFTISGGIALSKNPCSGHRCKSNCARLVVENFSGLYRIPLSRQCGHSSGCGFGEPAFVLRISQCALRRLSGRAELSDVPLARPRRRHLAQAAPASMGNLRQLVLCGGDPGGKYSPGDVHRHSGGPMAQSLRSPRSNNIDGRPRAQRK